MKTEPSSSLLIADTSGIISLFSATDNNHARALALVEQLRRTPGSILVPSDVFVETVNVVGKKLGHEQAIAIGTALSHEPPFMVAEAMGDVLHQAFARFAGQPASVSLTDCIVMAVADSFETRAIFGFDAVFQRNGYRLPAVGETEEEHAAESEL